MSYLNPTQDYHESNIRIIKWLFYLRRHCIIKGPLYIVTNNIKLIPVDGEFFKNKLYKFRNSDKTKTVTLIHVPYDILNYLIDIPKIPAPDMHGFKKIVLSEYIFDSIITNNIMLARLQLIRLIQEYKIQLSESESRWLQKYTKTPFSKHIHIKDDTKPIIINDYKIKLFARDDREIIRIIDQNPPKIYR